MRRWRISFDTVQQDEKRRRKKKGTKTGPSPPSGLFAAAQFFSHARGEIDRAKENLVREVEGIPHVRVGNPERDGVAPYRDDHRRAGHEPLEVPRGCFGEV